MDYQNEITIPRPEVWSMFIWYCDSTCFLKYLKYIKIIFKNFWFQHIKTKKTRKNNLK
jgi:hypothetical protein